MNGLLNKGRVRKMPLKVMLMKDSYDGAYESFIFFYEQIKQILENKNIDVVIANDVDEAISYFENEQISFTISIGQYHFFKNNTPLYDVYKIMNYQWIIDNPLRYESFDPMSLYNKPVYIDRNFSYFNDFKYYHHLSLPLPISISSATQNKEFCILAPLKVKSLRFFETMINTSSMKDIMWAFINSYDLDEPFSVKICDFMKNNSIDDIRTFFELTNGYIRIKKRLKFISSIKRHKVVVLSKNIDNLNLVENIIFKDPVSYSETIELIDKYVFVLNVNPNFDYCIHDRALLAIMQDSIVISDKNGLLDELSMPLCLKYSQLDEVDKLLDDIVIEKIKRKQKECIKNYYGESVIDQIISDFKKGIQNVVE